MWIKNTCAFQTRATFQKFFSHIVFCLKSHVTVTSLDVKNICLTGGRWEWAKGEGLFNSFEIISIFVTCEKFMYKERERDDLHKKNHHFQIERGGFRVQKAHMMSHITCNILQVQEFTNNVW